MAMTDFVRSNGNEFELFVPLSKINEKTGEFEAWATLEEIDQSNEIIDIDKSFPYFEALAERFSKITGGANFGPLREQHDANKAAGHLISPPVIKTHDSGARGIYITGLVTDDGTRKKLAAKTLTGVSIGGTYIGDAEMVKVGGRDVKKFVADPNHYGIVDSPCVKNALITVVKADGSVKQERLVGFNPQQGFQCRAGAFHIAKVEAAACNDPHSSGLAKVAQSGDAIIEKCLSCVCSVIYAIQAATTERPERVVEYPDGYVYSDPGHQEMEAGIKQLFDALRVMVNEFRSEWLADEGIPDDEAAMKVLTGLANKITSSHQFFKSLRVHKGNGSTVTKTTESKEAPVSTTATPTAPVVTKVDCNDPATPHMHEAGVCKASAPGTADSQPILKAIGDLGAKFEATMTKAAQAADEHEKAIGTLVKVVDHLQKQLDAYGEQPAAPMGALRTTPVTKAADAAPTLNEPAAPAAPAAPVQPVRKYDDQGVTASLDVMKTIVAAGMVQVDAPMHRAEAAG